jgi:hypothetical protein
VLDDGKTVLTHLLPAGFEGDCVLFSAPAKDCRGGCGEFRKQNNKNIELLIFLGNRRKTVPWTFIAKNSSVF